MIFFKKHAALFIAICLMFAVSSISLNAENHISANHADIEIQKMSLGSEIPEEVKNSIFVLTDKYFEWQEQAITQLNTDDKAGIFADNICNYMHIKAVESYTKAALWLFDYNDSYSCKIVERNLVPNGNDYTVKYKVYIKTHSLANPEDVFCEKSDIRYTFTVSEVEGIYYIVNVSTNDVFYALTYNGINKILNSYSNDTIDKKAIDEASEEWLVPKAKNAIIMKFNYPGINIPDLEYEFDKETMRRDLMALNGNVENNAEKEKPAQVMN